jgi:hypothetical protein
MLLFEKNMLHYEVPASRHSSTFLLQVLIQAQIKKTAKKKL